MNEAQRQFYLKQCGITLWYSHVSLPGAAPSIEFEFPLPQDDQPSLPAVSGLDFRAGVGASVDRQALPVKAIRERVIPAEQKSTLHQVVAGVSPAEKAAGIKAAEQSAGPAGGEAQQVDGPRLSVELRIAVIEDFVVIAQLGKDLSTEVQEELLLSIIHALGQPVSSGSVQALTWPAFSNMSVPGNDNAGLIALLEHVLNPLVSKTWLGLGLDVQTLIHNMRGQPNLRQSNDSSRLHFENDLGALASSGRLKRKLWNLIRGSVALASKSEH